MKLKPTSPEFKQKQLEEMHEYAKKRNGKCLATEYLNSHTRYLWEDSEGNQWLACWYNYKQRGGWSKKAGYEKNAKALIKYNIDMINEKFAKPKGGKLISTEYKNTRTKLEWEDSQGRRFFMTLANVINGQWSPFEKADKIGNLKRKYDPEFCHKYAESHGGKFLSTELTIIRSRDPMKWQDKNGEVFYRNLYDILTNPFIAPKKSMGEYEISEFLKQHNIEFSPHCRKTLNTKFELDFYIPEKKMAIEYHGLKWHTEEKLGKNYHLNKLKMANDVGISLIQIFEHEWRNRKFQVKSFLKSKLGLNKQKVFARNCQIKEVPKDEAKFFLDDNHIQGSGRFKFAYGLYHNNELKMLVAFGDHHRGGNELVLTRCVSLFDTTVVGGLSKLCKHVKNIKGSFITWVDLRWSDGTSWEAIGWVKEQVLKPDYFYYHSDKKIITSKQSRAKNKCATPENMTELEFAQSEGFSRIFDAGKVRLRYK
jgi:hypothetical protein